MKCSIQDERFASIASLEAQKSTIPKKHGCIAVLSGKIIAKGHNSYRTYSKDGFITNCCSCHAEVDVLRKCNKIQKFSNMNFYIVRISDMGEYRDSTPCNQCINAMKKMKIKYIIYSVFNDLVKCKLQYLHNQHMTEGEKAIVNNRVYFEKKGNYTVFRDNLKHS